MGIKPLPTFAWTGKLWCGGIPLISECFDCETSPDLLLLNLGSREICNVRTIFDLERNGIGKEWKLSVVFG